MFMDFFRNMYYAVCLFELISDYATLSLVINLALQVILAFC